ncbi:IS200/IS605 family accessory protein TnpB-related protein [Paenibacillus larvae]|nr:IS200/IS605 family accessory protein TnpB-related protein [Paenibacillus larvae]MDT2236514.1 IS200/IS605 family accessory protein TnpB-related protein [Paenibacillus larvae]
MSIIKLERLENIRKTARTSRKNAKNLHGWTFYQLQQFISYKANLVGIKIVGKSCLHFSNIIHYQLRRRTKRKAEVRMFMRIQRSSESDWASVYLNINWRMTVCQP